MKIRPTQDYVRFDEISIGSPFYFLERFWVRTAYMAGTEFKSTNVSLKTRQTVSTCTFRVQPFDEEYHEFYVDQSSGWFMVQAVEVYQ